MKRQVIMIILLCVFSIVARGQNTTTVSDVQGDTLKKTEQRQKCHRTPVNDYSGLNSLRARLANRFWDGNSDTTMVRNAESDELRYVNVGIADADAFADEDGTRIGKKGTGHRYFNAVVSEGIPVGVPVLIFFKGGEMQLTDPSQLINVRAVAELAKEYGFKVRVTGSADSATGSPERNETVALNRAIYISDILAKEGLPEENIVMQSVGGVDSYSPASANRNSRIEMVLQ